MYIWTHILLFVFNINTLQLIIYYISSKLVTESWVPKAHQKVSSSSPIPQQSQCSTNWWKTSMLARKEKPPEHPVYHSLAFSGPAGKEPKAADPGFKLPRYQSDSASMGWTINKSDPWRPHPATHSNQRICCYQTPQHTYRDLVELFPEGPVLPWWHNVLGFNVLADWCRLIL